MGPAPPWQPAQAPEDLGYQQRRKCDCCCCSSCMGQTSFSQQLPLFSVWDEGQRLGHSRCPSIHPPLCRRAAGQNGCRQSTGGAQGRAQHQHSTLCLAPAARRDTQRPPAEDARIQVRGRSWWNQGALKRSNTRPWGHHCWGWAGAAGSQPFLSVTTTCLPNSHRLQSPLPACPTAGSDRLLQQFHTFPPRAEASSAPASKRLEKGPQQGGTGPCTWEGNQGQCRECRQHAPRARSPWSCGPGSPCGRCC